MTYGSTGTGGSLHLGTEMIAEKAGIKLVHVPFKGAAEVNAAVGIWFGGVGLTVWLVKPTAPRSSVTVRLTVNVAAET